MVRFVLLTGVDIDWTEDVGGVDGVRGRGESMGRSGGRRWREGEVGAMSWNKGEEAVF